MRFGPALAISQARRPISTCDDRVCAYDLPAVRTTRTVRRCQIPGNGIHWTPISMKILSPAYWSECALDAVRQTPKLLTATLAATASFTAFSAQFASAAPFTAHHVAPPVTFPLGPRALPANDLSRPACMPLPWHGPRGMPGNDGRRAACLPASWAAEDVPSLPFDTMEDALKEATAGTRFYPWAGKRGSPMLSAIREAAAAPPYDWRVH